MEQTAPPVRVKPELLEEVFEGKPLAVEAEHAEAYARATNDGNPAYAGGATPPLLAVRYHIELAKQLIGDPKLEVDLMRLVHGEQDMRFHGALRVGDVVTPRLRLTGVEHKERGSLMRLLYTLWRGGELVNECFTTYFVRKPGGKKKKGDPSAGVEAPAFTATVEVGPNQSRDYAEASLDINPLHISDEFAQAVGFPGVILHGLCSLAFASQAVVQSAAGGDPTRLGRIKCRFSKPVFMGDRLTTRGVSERDGAEVRFDVVNHDGLIIISEGEATILASGR